MKISFFYLLLLVTTIVSAQKNSSVHIEYDVEIHNAKPTAFVASLDVKDGVSIYLPKYMTTMRLLSEKKSTVSKGIYPDWEYMMINHNAKTVLFFDSYGSNDFLVEDAYFKHSWAISGETKQIAGHSCTQATLRFRGVEWIVWFAPDIPLPYGPWKLYGLPGIIMEATDNSGTYVWRVNKIEYKESELFSKGFKTLLTSKNSEPINLKEFIEEQKEFYDNAATELLRTTPGMTVLPSRSRTGYELKYEWEQ